MILAVLYCLEYNLEFCLYTRSWSATIEKGWQDYFVPFCCQYDDLYLYRPPGYGSSFERAFYFYQKYFMPHCLFLYDIWDRIRSNEFRNREFAIPELGIDGDIFHAKQVILKMIYCYNDMTQETVHSKDQLLESMKPYIAIHIRRGDKVKGFTKEAEYIEATQYINKIKRIDSGITNIFIATDAYQAFADFQRLCPANWRVTTFCLPHKRGHQQLIFNLQPKQNKKNAMLDLFIDLHFLSKAEIFIGTYSSNIGRFVALFRGGDRCHSLDTKWHGL